MSNELSKLSEGKEKVYAYDFSSATKERMLKRKLEFTRDSHLQFLEISAHFLNFHDESSKNI